MKYPATVREIRSLNSRVTLGFANNRPLQPVNARSVLQ
jgi:hypothetical protein